MPTILGVNFAVKLLWGPETLEKQGRKISGKKIRHQDSLSNSLAIFLKFTGPK